MVLVIPGITLSLIPGITLPPTPTTPCTSLRCLEPYGIPAHLPQVYTSTEGWECAVVPGERGLRHDYAICAYAVGPQVDLNRIVNHPTKAKLALSLWADPDLNGVRWKGEGQP